MSMCELLMPDVVVSKAHQNNRSYVSSADLSLDSLGNNLAWWAVTRRTSKNHKTVKIGGGRLLGTIRYVKAVAKWKQQLPLLPSEQLVSHASFAKGATCKITKRLESQNQCNGQKM